MVGRLLVMLVLCAGCGLSAGHGLGSGTVTLAQETVDPGASAYLEGQISLLLANPMPPQSSDQMLHLLGFLLNDTLFQAGTLMQDPAIDHDPRLQSELIALTGVWDAIYDAAVIMPPASNPEFAAVQDELLEAMRLATVAGNRIRDYCVTGDQQSLVQANAAFIAIEQLGTSIA